MGRAFFLFLDLGVTDCNVRQMMMALGQNLCLMASKGHFFCIIRVVRNVRGDRKMMVFEWTGQKYTRDCLSFAILDL